MLSIVRCLIEGLWIDIQENTKKAYLQVFKSLMFLKGFLKSMQKPSMAFKENEKSVARISKCLSIFASACLVLFRDRFEYICLIHWKYIMILIRVDHRVRINPISLADENNSNMGVIDNKKQQNEPQFYHSVLKRSIILLLNYAMRKILGNFNIHSIL